MPRALKYVVEGSGLDQRQATDGAALVCNRLRSLVALADNSHVAPAYPELVLDTSAGRSDTDFWQYETPPRTRVEPPTRHLQSTLLNDFIATVTAFPAANQLISAFEHYNLALDRIRPGFEVELMMRIYVCAEALAKAAIEESAKRNNNNKSAVRDEFGAPNSGAIEEWIRIEHIFEGDGNLYKALRLARHGYAHGRIATISSIVLQRETITAALEMCRKFAIKLLPLATNSAKRLLDRSVYQDLLLSGLGGALPDNFTLSDARRLGYNFVRVQRFVKSVTEPNPGDRRVTMGVSAVTNIDIAVKPGNPLYKLMIEGRNSNPTPP